MYNNELTHYGIKGQKWGIRRYQNKDGTLTPAGKKKVSKEYKKLADKAQQEADSKSSDRYIKAYNKAADDMNNGLTDKYNADYDKKLGSKAKNHDYMNDDEYTKGYEKMFDDLLVKHYNTALANDIKNNKNYQKAKKLCDKYNMTKFDDFARETEDLIKQYE